ncbi:MAG: porin [Verrucomicrobiales bacterium]
MSPGSLRYLAWVFALPLLFGSSVTASERSSIWDLPQLYRSETNPLLQSFSLTGLIHYQFASVHADRGAFDTSEFRRFRFGAKAQFFRNFYFSIAANLDPELSNGSLYEDQSTAFISWSPYGNEKNAIRRFHLAAGKMKPRFTREYSTSAKKLKTFERSLLTNMLAPAKANGFSLGGAEGIYSYTLAAYSGGDPEAFSRPESGGLVLAKLGVDITPDLNLGLDYFWGSEDQDLTAPIRQAISLSFSYNEDYENGRLAVIGDLMGGLGVDGRSPDMAGLVILPSYQLSERFELVGRYQYARSNGPGLRAQRRYEREIGLPEASYGNRYHAGYLGLNYSVYGPNLKLMTGIEFSDIAGSGDYHGYTFFSGVRLYF